jgi:hypothetical protein
MSHKLHKTKNISQTLRHNGRMTFIIHYKSFPSGKQITEVFELNSKKNNNNFINSYFLNFTFNFVLMLLFLGNSTFKNFQVFTVYIYISIVSAYGLITRIRSFLAKCNSRPISSLACKFLGLFTFYPAPAFTVYIDELDI